MDTRWFNHLPIKEHEERKRKVQLIISELDILEEVLDKEMQEYAPDYKSPSWAYEQAHQNGWNAAIRSIKKLIKV